MQLSQSQREDFLHELKQLLETRAFLKKRTDQEPSESMRASLAVTKYINDIAIEACEQAIITNEADI